MAKRKSSRKARKKTKRKGGQFTRDIERMPGQVLTFGKKGIYTGVGVTEDIGKVGLKVGKTAKKLSKRGLKKITGKKKGKSKKSSYRAFLSKELKRVKKAHPSWPQSKVFKEAVKGWKK